MMIRKQRWKLRFSLGAVVWTTVPVTRHHLWRQRMRWRRNMIKILMSKHRDRFVLGRYGPANAWLAVQMLLIRLLIPIVALIGLFWLLLINGPLHTPAIIVTFYWIAVTFLLVRLLIAREIAGTPKPVNFPLVFLYPFYILLLIVPMIYAEVSELFRIGAKHPYVPDHVWEEIPWW